MARFDDSEFDPQTYGSQGQGGLLGLFQGMLQPKPAVPDPVSSAGGVPNYNPETPFSPQQDLIGRLRALQDQQRAYSQGAGGLRGTFGASMPSPVAPAPTANSSDALSYSLNPSGPRQEPMGGPGRPQGAAKSKEALDSSDLSAMTASIVGAESSGDPNAKNSKSSASGLGQFIDGTWLDMLHRYHPEITGTRESLLAMRNNPDLSREMTEAYTGENAAMLKHWGLPTTPGNLYLAHFAGAGGAHSVLSADPNTPVTQLLKADAIKANPFLAKMTANDLRNWAEKRIGKMAARRTQAQSSAPDAAAQPNDRRLISRPAVP